MREDGGVIGMENGEENIKNEREASKKVFGKNEEETEKTLTNGQMSEMKKGIYCFFEQ